MNMGRTPNCALYQKELTLVECISIGEAFR